MSFVLFFDKKADKLTPIEMKGYELEEKLQGMIAEHPEVLSLPSSGSIATFVSEYPVPTGSIDLLAVDEDGGIFLIETKLHKNYDRRKAIAQLLEYASQLALHDTFESFEDKIYAKTGMILSDLITDKLGNDGEDVIGKIQNNLVQGKFTLVLVMDGFDEATKDTIIFLNRNSKMNILGVELRRFVIDEEKEVFVPNLVGAEHMKKESSSSTPEDFLKNYADKGLESEMKSIVLAFQKAAEKYDNVQLDTAPRTLLLKIKNGDIRISFHIEPDKDHGIWLYNTSLSSDLMNVGEQLGLTSVLPRSDQKYAKTTNFNGIEGIRQVEPIIGSLIEKLVALPD